MQGPGTGVEYEGVVGSGVKGTWYVAIRTLPLGLRNMS